MISHSERQAARQRVIEWLRGFNKKVTNRITMRFAGKRVYAVVYHRGRKSGKDYQTPVVAMPTGDCFVFPLPYGAHTDWCRNLMAAGGGRMQWRGGFYALRSPRLIQPEEAVPAFPQWLRPLLRRTEVYLQMERALQPDARLRRVLVYGAGVLGSSGVLATSLGQALVSDPGLVDPYFTRCACYDRHAFVGLNTAFTEDGAFLYIPANVVVPEPVHILYLVAEGAPLVTHPRTIVVVGDNSQAKIIESYGGPDGQRYLTNAVTEIVVGENANVEHYRVQREGHHAYHVSSTHVFLERAAVFAQQAFTFGGAIVRNDVNASLGAEGIHCTLNGLYLANGTRMVGNLTAIDHAKPNCESHEIYKGMLDGQSRAVFNGKIFVRPQAQKTDAKQTNQVLLLSDDATINTKPQLEIFADDVKCTHGATVGQLDETALFYLRARGIGYSQARSMLVHAFASDIIDRVTIEPLRETLEETLLAELPKVAVIS